MSGYALPPFLLDVPDVDVGVHRAGDQEIRLKHRPVQVTGNTRKKEGSNDEKALSPVPEHNQSSLLAASESHPEGAPNTVEAE